MTFETTLNLTAHEGKRFAATEYARAELNL